MFGVASARYDEYDRRLVNFRFQRIAIKFR